jgi:hypothetical protein
VVRRMMQGLKVPRPIRADVIDLYASAVFQWVASQNTIIDRITRTGSGVGSIDGDC